MEKRQPPKYPETDVLGWCREIQFCYVNTLNNQFADFRRIDD